MFNFPNNLMENEQDFFLSVELFIDPFFVSSGFRNAPAGSDKRARLWYFSRLTL